MVRPSTTLVVGMVLSVGGGELGASEEGWRGRTSMSFSSSLPLRRPLCPLRRVDRPLSLLLPLLLLSSLLDPESLRPSLPPLLEESSDDEPVEEVECRR